MTFFCRMLMTQPWSTSEKTPKQRRPLCSSLFLSDSSKRTRSDNSCFTDMHQELLHYTCSHQWLFIIWPLKHCFCVCQQAELDIEQRNKQHEAPLTPPKPEVMGNKVGTINSQCRKSTFKCVYKLSKHIKMIFSWIIRLCHFATTL